MSTLSRLPDDAWADEQVQQALSILSALRAHEWESLRSEREAKDAETAIAKEEGK